MIAQTIAWFKTKLQNKEDFRRARLNHAFAEAAYHVPSYPAFPSTVEE
jgi:hypothetical protein